MCKLYRISNVLILTLLFLCLKLSQISASSSSNSDSDFSSDLDLDGPESLLVSQLELLEIETNSNSEAETNKDNSEKSERLYKEQRLIRKFNEQSKENIKHYFFESARNGAIDIFKKAIKHVDINSRDNTGKTALIIAALEGQTEIVDLLLKQKMLDINRVGQNLTALIAAVDCNNYKIVKMLLDAVIEVKDNAGNVIEHIIADRNIRDNVGSPALICAISRKNLCIARLLLRDSKTNVNVLNNFNMSPLHRSIEKNCIETLRLLLSIPELDIDIKIENELKYGETALELALKNNNYKIVELLVAAGASLEPLNRKLEKFVMKERTQSQYLGQNRDQNIGQNYEPDLGVRELFGHDNLSQKAFNCIRDGISIYDYILTLIKNRDIKYIENADIYAQNFEEQFDNDPDVNCLKQFANAGYSLSIRNGARSTTLHYELILKDFINVKNFETWDAPVNYYTTLHYAVLNQDANIIIALLLYNPRLIMAGSKKQGQKGEILDNNLVEFALTLQCFDIISLFLNIAYGERTKLV